MKIYQIHEYGGEWEDRYDYIFASYLSKEKAIIRKEQLEQEEAELMKCSSCPLYFCPMECNLECDTEECIEYTISLAKQCKEYEPIDKTGCKNRYIKYDESFYRIEEIEVVE